MGYNYWNGTEAAHRRVMMKAAGYSDEDIRQKPHIGIPNSYMAGSPGTAHLRQVTEAVTEGMGSRRNPGRIRNPGYLRKCGKWCG